MTTMTTCQEQQQSNHFDTIPEPPPSTVDSFAHVMHRIAYHDAVAAHLLARAPRHLILTRAIWSALFEAVVEDCVVDGAAQSASTTPSGDASARRFAYRPYKLCTIYDNDKVHLMTIRSELSIQPLPVIFLQTRAWAPCLEDSINYPSHTELKRPLVYIALDWRDYSSAMAPAIDKKTEAENDIPTPLLDVVRHDSPWPWMTDTQIVDLVTKAIAEMDFMPPSLYFIVSLQSVLITNPSRLGTAKPLSFRFCPFSVGMDRELSSRRVSKHQLMRRSGARLLLHLATRLEDLDSPLLKKRLARAFTRSPGLVAAFFDLWDASATTQPNGDIATTCHESMTSSLNALSVTTPSPSTIPPSLLPNTAKMMDLSPSLHVFKLVRTRTHGCAFKVEHVPGLLTAVQCHDSITMYSTAIDGLWRFILSASDAQLANALGILSQCIACLVPSDEAGTGLSDPSSNTRSTPWILRMNIIDRILFELERSGDYTRLRVAQQALLDAGIGSQLGGALVSQKKHCAKFTLKVLMPMVRVTTLMAFHNPIIGVRHLFDRNVRKMSRMCLDATSKGDLHPTDLDRFVSTMLVTSDFMKWCGGRASNIENATTSNDKYASIDEKLLALWERLDEDTFLLYALPCWTRAISDATTATLVSKLEAAFYRSVQVYMQTANCEEEQKSIKRKLMYILDWLVAFAWNAPEQVSVASYQSLYTSYFVGLIFRNPAQSVCFDSPSSGSSTSRCFFNEFEDADKDEDVLLPHLMRTMPASSSLPRRHHPLFSDAVEVPWTMPDENIQSSIDFLDSRNVDNPEALAQVHHTFKFAIAPRHLIGFAKHHQASTALARYYVPMPNDHGAPASKDSIRFDIPGHRKDLFYYYRHETSVETLATTPVTLPGEDLVAIQADDKCEYICSRSPDEMRYADPSYEKKPFEPITLIAANHRLCRVNGNPVQGTTGMMDVLIADSGERNDITIGVTWNLEADSIGGGLDKIIPGRTPHSLGIAVATGHVYFLDKDGGRNKLPYTVPCGTSSRLCIGIAYNKLYFVLDNVFYPPIPDITIPDGCDVFGLVRIGCSGVKLTARTLTNQWNLDERCSEEDGSPLKHAKTNPVAHNLYLAELRTKVCLHYHTHKKPKATRPHLTAMTKTSAEYLVLPDEARELVDRVHLACAVCTPTECPAFQYVKDVASKITGTPSSS